MQKSRFLAPLLALVGALALTLPALAQPPQTTAPETAPQPSPTPSGETAPAQSSSALVASDTPQTASAAATPKVVPRVTILVNGTPVQGDDLVLWNGSNLIAADYTTRCSIYLANAAEYGADESVTIVLNNSDNHVSFSGQDINGHLTLTLTGANDQGNPQTFDVMGTVRNSTANSTIINAHENNVYTPIVGTENMTVYWFGEDNISLEAKSGYLLYARADPNGNPVYSYRTNGGPAIEMRAQSVAKPLGIDLRAPQLSKWRVGIVQNVVSANYTIRGADPYITYKRDPAGSFVVPRVRSAITDVTSRKNDYTQTPNSGPFTPPLYRSDTLALKTPLPGNVAVTSDAPSFEDVNLVVQRFDASGDLELSYSYGSAIGYMKGQFDTYSALIDTSRSDNNVYPRRRTGWSLNISSATVGGANPNSTDGPYQNDANLSKTESANAALRASGRYVDSGTTVRIQ